MDSTTHNRFGSSFTLLIGLVTAVAATVVVFAFAKHDGSVATDLSDDWDDIIGM